MPSQPAQNPNTSVPAYSISDGRVDPGSGRATVSVRRNGPSQYSAYMESHVEGGEGWSPAQGQFVFDHDVDEIVIVLQGRPGAAQRARIVLTNLRVFNVSPTFARQVGSLGPDVEAITPMAGAVSRTWDQPIRRVVTPAWKRDFFSDLVKDFTCTATGRDAAGRPCFKNALAHGRAQFSNGEVGLYSDPSMDGTNPLQMLNGKRLLVPEKLPKVIRAQAGAQAKDTTYSTPLVSTETLPLLGYGRFEYRFALLAPQQGMWPAGWSLCLPHWRWPDCEQDTVEISFNKADPRQVLPYTTNWWRNEAGKPQSEGQFNNLFGLLPGFDYGKPHTYWSEWTPERLAWGVDETLMFSVPNRFFLKNPADPHDPNRLYMMLQIALGGAGGDCAKGSYPVAPSTYAPGAPAMLVEHMAHFAMPG